MPKDTDFLKISDICIKSGFHKRGNILVRMHGDGIVQLLQYARWDRPFPHVDLNLGLRSMYGKIDAAHLTSKYCNAIYGTHWLEQGFRERFLELCRSPYMDDHRTAWQYGLNLEFVRSVLLPFLDSIKTQQQLSEALCYLDRNALNFRIIEEPIWSDIYKFAPYMRVGNYKMAQKVINAIINQRENAKERNRQRFSPEDYTRYAVRLKDEDDWLNSLKVLAESEDELAVRKYLEDNYRNNLKLLEPFNKCKSVDK